MRKTKIIKVGSDFSGVGAFNQSLMRLDVEYKELFACDMDKYARQTFIHNYGEPEYYPTNVYDREIPSESLDIYMTSPPCQAFSLAGKRLGKDDKRGILFFNSHEFIQKNKPRYFIFENVKGLLSDDGGKTFQEWINMLGGKSVNGVPVLFPYEESVPYHLYWQVLNAKHHGVPQNRERVFLIGIRDDADNNFQFPREEHLSKKLKDVLEDDVDDKYFVKQETKDVAYCIDDLYYKGNRAATVVKVGTWRTHKDGQGFRQIEDGNCPTIPARAREDGSGQPVIKIKYNDKRLTQTVNQNNFTKGVPSAIDSYNQSVSEIIAPTVKLPHNDRFMFDGYKIRRLTPRECFRLMDFPDTFTWNVSDSQAYKQAGNSIVVNVLYKIIKNLKL
jgi:DNA (cytosine-5)-methyltransferase 1